MQGVGLAIMAVGILVRSIAIAQLGRFHTPNVAIRADHQLRVTGLYRVVRHPSYLGALIAYFGFGLALGNWLSVLILMAVVPALYLYRMHEEGAAMLATDGVFSMDGDVAPLRALSLVARMQHALFYVDDAHGVGVDIDYQENYPVTANDSVETDFALRVARRSFGEQRVFVAPRPMAGSEDFSFVLDEVPGAYLMLGAVPPGTDPATAPMNHAPQAVFDDRAVGEAAVLLASLAATRLAEAS